MKTIKIKDMLKDKMDGNDFKSKISVKRYASLSAKIQIRYGVINNIITQYGGINRIDYVLRDVHKGMLIAGAYSNIDFSELDDIEDSTEYNQRYIESYDELSELGVIDHIYKELKSINIDEYNQIVEIIDKEVEQQEKINMSAYSAMMDGISMLSGIMSGMTDTIVEDDEAEVESDKKESESDSEDE